MTNNNEGVRTTETPGGQHTLPRMLESMPDGLVVMNRDWVYTYANAQAERLLQVARGDILHRSLWDCFPEIAQCPVARTLREAMASGDITETEDYWAPLGIWLEVRAVPFPDGMTIFFRDVTGRRRQAEALRESNEALRRTEERFRALTEHCSDLVTILAPDGTIAYDSPSITAILGYGQNDRLGTNLRGYLHEDDLPELQAAWQHLHHEKSPTVLVTHRLRQADGTWRWMESVGSLQIDNPAIGGIVVNTRDVTERRRMEEQFTQAAKLAAIGELVAGVAHEINNPLSAISGHAQLLRHHADPQVRQDAAVIEEMVQRMSRIIRSLSLFSRRTGDEQTPRRAGSLNDVVQSALDVIGSRLRGRDVAITLALAPNLPPVRMNAGEIEQVLVNLLVNAEQALRVVDPTGRSVHIATSLQSAPSCRVLQRPCCLLTVTDSGPGIPPHILPRIFEPFFTTKDIGEGTGLGLSLSQSIVAAHGGSLTARNRHAGNGVTFTLELPSWSDDASGEP